MWGVWLLWMVRKPMKAPIYNFEPYMHVQELVDSAVQGASRMETHGESPTLFSKLHTNTRRT